MNTVQFIILDLLAAVYFVLQHQPVLAYVALAHAGFLLQEVLD